MDRIENILDKMISFSRTSIIYLEESWGVPEPFNFVLYIFISVLVSLITQKLFAALTRRGQSEKGYYRFN